MERYTIGNPIGKGAFGEVCKGRDKEKKKDVAIKIISIKPEDRESHPEIQGLAGVPAHRNIVQIFEVYFPSNYKAWVVMELCDHNLKRHYETDVTIEEGVKVMKQCMKGLDHLHKHGVTHRDLKPLNILIKSKTAKITDFGLAKLADLDPDISEKYMSTMCGTPCFMAPEILNRKPYNNTVDIYSMGVTFLWMNDRRHDNHAIKQLADDMASPVPTERPDITKVLKRLDAVRQAEKGNDAQLSKMMAGVKI